MQEKGTLNELRENIEKYKKYVMDIDVLQEEIVQVLALRDEINRLISTLQEKGVDLSVEKSKIDSLDHIIKDQPQVVLKKIKKHLNLVAHRKEKSIPSSHWWWYVDEIVRKEKKNYVKKWIKRIALAAGAILCVYLILTYAVPEPEPYVNQITKADGLLEEGKLNPALEAYKEAIQIAPQRPHAYLMAGIINGFLGGEREAEKYFREAKQRYPSLFQFYLERGMGWMKLGQFSAAEKDAQKAVELKSKSAEAHFLLGNTYEAQGKIAKAIAQFSIVSDMEADPKLTVMARYKVGMLTLKQVPSQEKQ